MANELQLGATEAYAIADGFAQASARILDFRVSRRTTLSEEDANTLEQCEDSLDHLVVLFRGYGIRLTGAGAQDAVTELKGALALGREAIAVINTSKAAIKAAQSLADLAVAVLAKSPQGVVAAARCVRAACKGFAKGEAEGL